MASVREVRLTDVYETHLAEKVLFDLLKERKPEQNISHKKMPSFAEHSEFVGSRPYSAWYLIQKDENYVGAVYLTRDDEIGVFIFKEHQGQGRGPWAVEQIMNYHPRERFLANINPRNKASKKMFGKLGFTHTQETMEIWPSN